MLFSDLSRYTAAQRPELVCRIASQIYALSAVFERLARDHAGDFATTLVNQMLNAVILSRVLVDVNTSGTMLREVRSRLKDRGSLN